LESGSSANFRACGLSVFLYYSGEVIHAESELRFPDFARMMLVARKAKLNPEVKAR
jgi:hypothetical protein